MRKRIFSPSSSHSKAARAAASPRRSETSPRCLRERKKMAGKIKAMSSEAKASAGIIGSLPVVVTCFLYLSSPDYISLLFTTFVGKMVLAGCGDLDGSWHPDDAQDDQFRLLRIAMNIGLLASNMDMLIALSAAIAVVGRDARGVLAVFCPRSPRPSAWFRSPMRTSASACASATV